MLLAGGSTWLERGADDLLALDAGEGHIDLALKRVAAWAAQCERHATLQNERQERDGFGGLVGRSAALRVFAEAALDQVAVSRFKARVRTRETEVRTGRQAASHYPLNLRALARE